ncbi:hypothetical protein EBU71_02565 [bacterium]|nr:hypothetical protein [Candidatus Elulimicrobium humile]
MGKIIYKVIMAQSMKETSIHDYFGKINLRDRGLNLSLIHISEPTREIKRLDSISVVFTDLDEKIKKIEFRV